MTPSPTDIQERETIARIIDPDAFEASFEEIVPAHASTYQAEALAKADAILALRSNPQPGSEGEPVAWRYQVQYPLGTWHTILAEKRPSLDAETRNIEPLYAASPTPPTAQPGEVERLREADDPAFVAALAREIHSDANGPSAWRGLHSTLTDLGREMYVKRMHRAIARARAALTPSESGEAGNV